MPDKVNEYEVDFVNDDKTVARIALGEKVLGGNDAMNFSSKLHELFDKDVRCLVADLEDVELINSSGLGMLVSGLSTLRKQEIHFALANVPGKVMNLLKMTHLDKVFSIYSTVGEASKNCK
jgi:anti-sigma B factor antagonist